MDKDLLDEVVDMTVEFGEFPSHHNLVSLGFPRDMTTEEIFRELFDEEMSDPIYNVITVFNRPVLFSELNPDPYEHPKGNFDIYKVPYGEEFVTRSDWDTRRAYEFITQVTELPMDPRLILHEDLREYATD